MKHTGMRFTLLLIVLMLSVSMVSAQTITTLTRDAAELHAGPGHTYTQTGVLNTETEVTVLARNRIGNWLLVEADDLSGWVRIADLTPADLTMSAIPLDDSLPDVDLENISDPDLARLYSVPILPTLSESLRDVHFSGQWRGNHDDVVVKVGDSNSANSRYLTPISEGNYNLGPYDVLNDAVTHFAANMGINRIAARVGLNAYSIFDSIWSTNDCEPNETPLACEYRISQPTIAVIMFGPNDLRVLNAEDYATQMTEIVTTTLDHGIIPVLLTFSANPDDEMWFQVLRFNAILVDIAAEYDVPLVNLWAAAGGLPNRGIGEDNVHMTVSGGSVDLSEGHESRFGVALQNLLVLHTLAEIYMLVN